MVGVRVMRKGMLKWWLELEGGKIVYKQNWLASSDAKIKRNMPLV